MISLKKKEKKKGRKGKKKKRKRAKNEQREREKEKFIPFVITLLPRIQIRINAKNSPRQGLKSSRKKLGSATSCTRESKQPSKPAVFAC